MYGLGLGLRAFAIAWPSILAEPAVASWWTTHDLDAVIAGTIDAFVWVIEERVRGHLEWAAFSRGEHQPRV